MRQITHVLVTGAGGFIGQDVVEYLLVRGYTVHALVHNRTPHSSTSHPNLKIFTGDILNLADLTKAARNCQAIVHLAANKYHPTESFKVNVGGAKNVIYAARKSGIRRIINISTQSTKIKQKGVYGQSKSQADEIFLAAPQLHLTILKPSLVYGNDPKSLFNTISMFIRKLPFVPVFGNGSWVSHPIHVRDLSRFIESCLMRSISIGKIYDIGCQKGISFNDLVKLIGKNLGRKPRKLRILHIPFQISLLLARLFNLPPLWKNGRTPPVTFDNVLGSNQSTSLDPLPAIKDLHINPLPVSIGVPLALKNWHPDKIHVAVIGIGKTGLTHAAILNSFPDVSLNALIDLPQNRSTIQSFGLNSRFYPSLETALKSEVIDVVFICSPTSFHLAQIKSAMKHHLHIFVEKPVVKNPDELEILKALLKNYPKHTAAGYFYQFRPVYAQVKKILDEKLYGKILGFSARVLHSEVLGRKKGWLFDKNVSGGGVLLNPTPHFYSLLYHYFGKPAKIVSKLNSVFSPSLEDEALVDFRYSSFKGSLYASWSVPENPVLQTLLKIDLARASLLVSPDKLTILTRKSTKVINFSACQNNLEKTLQISSSDVVNLAPFSGGEGYFYQDRHFINCLKTGKKFPNNLQTALEIETIIHDSYAAKHP